MAKAETVSWLFPSSEEQKRRCLLILGALTVTTLLWMSSITVVSLPQLSVFHVLGYRSSSQNETSSENVIKGKTFDLSDYFQDVSGNQAVGIELESTFQLEERLALINELGPDEAKLDQSTYTIDDLLAFTMQRLQLRVRQRLAHAGRYAEQLHQSTPITGTTLYVSHVIIDGGLGNWMFMVGSMFGVARKNGRRPSLQKTYWAEKNFKNFSIEKKNRTLLFGNESQAVFESAIIGEAGPGRFNPAMMNVTAAKGPRNVMLAGYMQSWRYFNEYREDIRSLFAFSQTVFNATVQALDKSIARYFNETMAEVPRNLPTLVGIHVRRGDILREDQRKHGHEPATEEYLLRTALHFQRTHSPVLFIVISNDIAYCKGLYKEPNFLFMEGNSEAVDMAVLSLMDHIILSVGSYGWWGAYLSDAREVYYFRNWPRNGSSMQRIFNLSEYFLPSWTSFE